MTATRSAEPAAIAKRFVRIAAGAALAMTG
jgi:hypothetical protein